MGISFYFKNTFFTFAVLFYTCIVIGFQMAFSLLTTIYIHTKTLTRIRSTASSVNNMVFRGLSGISLIILNLTLNYFSLSISLFFCCILFLIGFPFIKKIKNI
jgi:hypothetical protein